MTKNFNTERQVRIMSAASVLRALRAEPDVRVTLMAISEKIMRAATQDSLVLLVSAKRMLANMQEFLEKQGGLDNTILSQALPGVRMLLLPEVRN